MIGTLRSVECNGKGCSGGVKAELFDGKLALITNASDLTPAETVTRYKALADIGDMAVGYLYSVAFGDAVQSALHSRRTGEKRALMNDCLTGTWARYISPPIPDSRVDKLSLSAGDLDEAIIEAIDTADPLDSTNVHGSAFEKVHAFRVGVLGGLAACNASF